MTHHNQRLASSGSWRFFSLCISSWFTSHPCLPSFVLVRAGTQLVLWYQGLNMKDRCPHCTGASLNSHHQGWKRSSRKETEGTHVVSGLCSHSLRNLASYKNVFKVAFNMNPLLSFGTVQAVAGVLVFRNFFDKPRGQCSRRHFTPDQTLFPLFPSMSMESCQGDFSFAETAR